MADSSHMCLRKLGYQITSNMFLYFIFFWPQFSDLWLCFSWYAKSVVRKKTQQTSSFYPKFHFSMYHEKNMASFPFVYKLVIIHMKAVELCSAAFGSKASSSHVDELCLLHPMWSNLHCTSHAQRRCVDRAVSGSRIRWLVKMTHIKKTHRINFLRYC